MFSARVLIGFVGVAVVAVLGGPVRGDEIQRRNAPRIEVPFQPRVTIAPMVDLRPEIHKLGLAIRDQGNRGTCSVFATTFLIEYEAARTKGEKNLDLSEEYLNWAKNRANKTDFDGGMFTDIVGGYQQFGMVPIKDMPYLASFDSKHPDAPTKAVIARGEKFDRYPITFIKKWDNQKGMTAKELEATKAELKAGHPVATGIWWLTDFKTVMVNHVPILKEFPRRDNSDADTSKNPMYDGHSIDLVGYHEDAAFPGGGYFIFRNSFGTGFGHDGYGFVSFKYLRDYSNDAICIEK